MKGIKEELHTQLRRVIKIKEFWYTGIEEYLSMSDNYDNPKTVKIFEISKTDKAYEWRVRAVTFLRTSMIGFSKCGTMKEIEELAKSCENHKHAQGVILDVGRVE